MTAGSRRARRWTVGLLPLIVVALIVAVTVMRDRLTAPSPANQDRPGPVLLVAGYGGSTRALSVLATLLRERGREVVIVPATGSNTGDLTEQAQTLDRTARQRLAAGAPSVDVVGYSAGGVVARIWAAAGGADVARRIVTLGSPHHGTDVAGLAAGLAPGSCPAACRQLAPGSAVLATLPQTPAGPIWVSIYTTDDDLVIPPETARLTGAVNVELHGVCADSRVKHADLPRDPLTLGLVERALDGPPLTAPPAPDRCTGLRADATR
jgi:pimeloyl-ACP methyl ester carboxylesterase